MHDSSTSFLDPIAKVWNHSSILGIAAVCKKKPALKAKKAKKPSLLCKKQYNCRPK